MDTNDFLGSFAQENVAFTTRVVRTNVVGDTYWKVMVFVENDRFVTVDATWAAVPGSTTHKALAVTADDYATQTKGLLLSWLTDLFANGFTGDCILVACGEKIPAKDADTDSTKLNEFIKSMEEGYELMKAYAYHKTVCAGDDDAVRPEIAVSLAKKCANDKEYLSAVPVLPFSTATPENADSDPLYKALKDAGCDAFMSAHQDKTRNAALFSLGLALGLYNGSGTVIGNSMDMTKSTMITSSGAGGSTLAKAIRDNLKAINVQTWKPVGDNSGNVAALGDKTLNGNTYAADWLRSYITFMVKVNVAQMITEPNFLKNASNYSSIIEVLSRYLLLFGESGSNRLGDITISAPAFGELPEAQSDQIIIPNAWSARYVDHIREVQITGTLYIGG